jgi:hypothetical protein
MFSMGLSPIEHDPKLKRKTPDQVCCVIVCVEFHTSSKKEAILITQIFSMSIFEKNYYDHLIIVDIVFFVLTQNL